MWNVSKERSVISEPFCVTINVQKGLCFIFEDSDEKISQCHKGLISDKQHLACSEPTDHSGISLGSWESEKEEKVTKPVIIRTLNQSGNPNCENLYGNKIQYKKKMEQGTLKWNITNDRGNQHWKPDKKNPEEEQKQAWVQEIQSSQHGSN